MIDARKQQLLQKARLAADPRNMITFTPKGTPNPNPTRTQVLRAAGRQDNFVFDMKPPFYCLRLVSFIFEYLCYLTSFVCRKARKGQSVGAIAGGAAAAAEIGANGAAHCAKRRFACMLCLARLCDHSIHKILVAPVFLRSSEWLKINGLKPRKLVLYEVQR